MADRVLHLTSKRTASITLLLALVLLLAGRVVFQGQHNTVVEAYPLPNASYHIEITGADQLIFFAYQTDVLDIDGCAQWEGIATVGISNMAFQQDCHSVYSPTVQAKLRLGKWLYAPATTPKNQFTLWLQEYRQGAGSCSTDPIAANTILPLPATDTRTAVTIHLPEATLDWNTLCDAQLDTTFGSQNFLTNVREGEVTIFLDSETSAPIGAVFTAQQGQTHISGVILVSAADGQALDPFPATDTITEGALYEDWALVEP